MFGAARAMADLAIEPVAEDTLLARVGAGIDAAINARVHAAARALRAAKLPGIVDVAPAYATLLVRFDPAIWLDDGARPQARVIRAIRAAIERAADANDAARQTPRVIEIPVCYGGDCGPDLVEVARHARLTPAEVIARHTAADYRVAMLGFAPGFPYLLGLDPALCMPRRANPRTRVPRGAVAIGGAQTGIYPRALPGGWQLIGRTPLAMFNAARAAPCLLAPGDAVRLRAIDPAEFARMEPVDPC
jgi:KipI family sensor histidine kinase inhibitor